MSASPEVDAAVSALLRGLRLSTRFHLYLVVCTSPELAAFALSEVERQLPAMRDAPVRLARVPVDFSGGERGDAGRSAFADEVVQALIMPSDADRAHGVIHVVDASRASPSEESDWRVVFGQMNASRDLIASALGGELVLVIAPWMEVLLRRVAPDLTAIESGPSVRLGDAPAAPYVERGARVEPVEGDLVALRERAIARCREAERSLNENEPRAALEAAQEGLRLAEAWRARVPMDHDAGIALYDARWWEGRAREDLGETDAAIAAFHASGEALGTLPGAHDALRRQRSERLMHLALVLERAKRVPEALDAASRAAGEASLRGDAETRFETGLAQMGLFARVGDLSHALRARRALEGVAEELGPEARRRLDEASRGFDARASFPSLTPLPHADGVSPPPPGGAYDPRWYVPRPELERKARAKLERAATPLVLTGRHGAGKRWLARRVLSAVAPPSRVVWVDLTDVGTTAPRTVEAVSHVLCRAFSPVATSTSAPPFAVARDAVEGALRGVGGQLYVVLDVPDRFAQWPDWVEVERVLRSWIDSAGQEPWSRLRLLAIYPLALHRALQRDERVFNSSLRAALLIEGASPHEVAAAEALYGVRLTEEAREAPGLIGDVVKALWSARQGAVRT